MSILPSEIQGFASSPSSEPLSPNPNPNHGSNISSPLSQSPTSPSGPVTGPMATVAKSSRSSKKVSQFVAQNGRNFGSSQRRGKMSEATTASHTQHGHGPVHSHGSTTQSSVRKAQGVSGNHLLNFQYDPISRPQYRPSPSPRRSYKRKPYNKDLFIQANYKFVVLDTGNYTPESMDPDKMLQWEDIICLRYSTPHQVQCPICLEYPLCPQITSCGHIFCFPCILQYLYLGEDCDKVENFKRCPLCFVMISKKDLYTIYLENVDEYTVGDSIEFMLLTRQKDSFAPTEKSGQGGTILPQTTNQIGNPFSKFTFTLDVDLSVRRAVTDIDGWLARAESGLVDDLEKLPYVAAAMEELEKRKKNWNQHAAFRKNRLHEYASYQSDSQSSPARSVYNTEHVKGISGMVLTDGSEQSSSSPQIEQGNSQAVDFVGQTPCTSQSSESKDQDLMSTNEITDLGRHLTVSLDIKESDSYNFYQVVDGQNIILHPLNMKILLHHYRNHEMLPHRIRGRILQLETVSQSESTRRRLRFLSHFSLTTTFQFCEIDLSEALPSDALHPFMDEIKKREKQRKQVARKEQRDKIRADAVNQIPIAIQYDIGQSSNFNFPTYSMDEFQALEGTSAMSTSPPAVEERQTFSNVTRLGFAAAHDSPSLKTEEDNSPPKSQAKSDFPTGSTSTPSFAHMISRAKPVESSLGSKKSEVGKKGKKPTQILLSTSGGRRY